MGPDFFCIGAQRAGTSWLYRQLLSHPDFWMPPRKELHYFNALGRAPVKTKRRSRDERDAIFFEQLETLSEEGSLDLASYGELFAAKGTLISGDITPAYGALSEEVIAQVTEFFPRAKVVFLARDPVERAWAQLSLDVRTGRLPAFDVNDAAAVLECLRRPAIAQRSSPSRIVARWQQHVPADQFRVFFFDDLQCDPAGFRRSIISFLGGDAGKPSGDLTPEHNTKANDPRLALSPEVKVRVAEFFAEELQNCAANLGGPAAAWPSRYRSE